MCFKESPSSQDYKGAHAENAKNNEGMELRKSTGLFPGQPDL